MARTRIKVCGITREQDLDAAVQAGVDAVGFVFYPKSPRRVTVEQARQLAHRLPPFVTAVGLFVNEEARAVQDIAARAGLQMLQFHGDEEPEYCERFALPYIKAARMQPGLDLLKYSERFSSARGMLLDAFVEGYGGGGEVFDWSLIPEDFAGRGARFVVSGGLRPSNAGDAIRALRPFAVDVSSGVESARGIKDAALIRQFVSAVHEADSQIAKEYPNET